MEIVPTRGFLDKAYVDVQGPIIQRGKSEVSTKPDVANFSERGCEASCGKAV